MHFCLWPFVPMEITKLKEVFFFWIFIHLHCLRSRRQFRHLHVPHTSLSLWSKGQCSLSCLHKPRHMWLEGKRLSFLSFWLNWYEYFSLLSIGVKSPLARSTWCEVWNIHLLQNFRLFLTLFFHQAPTTHLQLDTNIFICKPLALILTSIISHLTGFGEISKYEVRRAREGLINLMKILQLDRTQLTVNIVWLCLNSGISSFGRQAALTKLLGPVRSRGVFRVKIAKSLLAHPQ